jgi:D-alanyl-D-alanine carboxypeptidase/D-alanyl-D-alanine-endopeptidase (penicillin-binding protein 4)
MGEDQLRGRRVRRRSGTTTTRARAIGAATIALAVGFTACTSSPTVDGAPVAPGSTAVGRSSLAGVPGLDESALEVMGKPEYQNGRWAISVRDVETGEVLVDLEADTMAEPGSATKSYSVGAAWLQWGPDHTVTTPVKRTGAVVDGAVQGDLVLVGKGDLTMGGRTKADGTVDFTNLDHNDANPLPGATLTPEDPLTGLDELATQVKASGIDAVSGQVVVDDRLFQSSLAGEDITPIIVNQNLIDVTTTPGSVGEVATAVMSPVVAPWTVTSEVETVAAGEETEIEIDSPAEGQIVLTGTIAADSDPVLKVQVLEDPSTFARTAFTEALVRAGVTVGGDPVAVNSTASLADPAAVDALPSVATLESLPLEEDATYVMKVSYNRGAQTLVCLLAVESGTYKPNANPGTECNGGLVAAASRWREAGMDTTGASIKDGSGLGGNLVTPANQTELQMIMAARPDAERWRSVLPILGQDGSLAAVQPDSPAAGKVFAKTGTLLDGDTFNGRYRLVTKALGGYMEAESGRFLAFTIIGTQGFFPDLDGVFRANDDVGAIAASLQQNL